MNNIYISTFGKKVIKLKNGVPVEVGASNRSNFLYPIHDNIGLNILVNIVHFYLTYSNKCVKSSVIRLDHRMILDMRIKL